MRFKSRFICILLIFVILLSVNVVAADGNATQTIMDESADKVSVSADVERNKVLGVSNNEILNAPDGTFQELQNLINGAGNVIVLNKSYSNTDNFNANGISISKSITIDGNGHTIDALNKGRIFRVTGQNVIIKNINFVNGFSTGNGGAIIFSTGGHCK